MFENGSSTLSENLERLIQFAAKSETTSQLQSYWFNRYAEALKSNLFIISESTINNLLKAEEVQKPVTPFGSINITKHLDINGAKTALNEGKLQSTLDVVVRLLDAVLDSVNFNTEAKFLVDEYRKVGISINDFQEYLKLTGGQKDYEIDYIGSLISNGSYRSSESLAEEKGVCQGWEMINKSIKPLTFEYWFNIDTGEIKSGKEIAAEFTADSIKNSKFEIVPRRNSHLLLLSESVEWKAWNDRDNIFNIKPINFVENSNEGEVPQITVGGENIKDIPQFEIPSEDDKVHEDMKENNIVLDGLSNSQLGSIEVTKNPELNVEEANFNNVEPDMVDLDDLISNINNDSITQQELFDPSGEKLNTELVNKESEKAIEPVDMENKESDEKKSFMSKLFSNPFGKNEKDSDGEEVSEKADNEPVEKELEKPLEDNSQEQKVEVDSETAQEVVEVESENKAAEQEPIFSVGELVRVVDQGHPKFNQYLQVIEVNEADLTLLDGNDSDHPTTSANFSQVEAASIEQVLGQLNQKDAVKQEVVEELKPSQEPNPVSNIDAPVSSINQGTVKVMLYTTNNDVLTVINKGRVLLPTINVDQSRLDDAEGIITLLGEDYNIEINEDFYSSGLFKDYVTGENLFGYFGTISKNASLSENLQFMNIVDAYNKSSDVTSFLDGLSDQQKDLIESKTHEDIIEEVQDEEQVDIIQPVIEETNQVNENIKEETIIEDNMTKIQINKENNSINTTPETVTATVQKAETQNVANSVTYFPQNMGSQINNNNMLYQSTSETASYSKFSILLKQIINTAEFGAIVLHIHYDTTGPKVLTVELPQLINDSVLQILRTYINLINASMIRGSDLSATVGLIKDQIDLAGENGSVSEIVDIILKGINALPKSVQELTATRVLTLDADTSKNIVKTGIDPLKALAEKYIK